MINWRHLTDAIDFYKTLGYQYVEVPWTVSSTVINATLPPGAFAAESTMGMLVGSAEQSFIAMEMLGMLGKGRFVACTPCFRPSDVEDDLHQRHFMKVELYVNDEVTEAEMFAVMGNAAVFMRDVLSRSGKRREKLVYQPTSEGWDLEIDGIEVGSYGVRSFDGINWVYGTGVAEPRFSTAIARL